MNRANTIRLGFLLTAVAVACAPQPPQRRVSPVTPTSPIDTTAIRGYTRFLSDDALAGRMTGTPSADLSALYIESACIGIGLSPIGKHYRQPIELERTAFSGSGTKLVLTGARGVRQFDYRSGFLPNMWFDSTAGFSGPAFYLGTSEDIIAGRIRSLDLRGGVAVLAGPLFEPADDTLKARGVVGVIQLTRDESQYLLYVRSRGDSRLRFADRSVATSLGGDEASIVASPALSRDIVAGVSVNSAPERTGDSVVVTVNARRTAVTSSNVGCMLEGTDPKLKDTAIAFTAHYDHLGVGLPDARGDSIYNGFSDNAAGVGMLLAIGSAFGGRPGPRPRHSILLLFFTGEEAGLLGSDYYVAHPEWPLQKTRAVINLDAGAPPAPPWSWRIAGANTALSQLAQDVAADHGWSATPSAASPNSDYFPFSRSGVQSIFLVPGVGPYQGLSADSSQALRRRWDHYHDPADEWMPDFPFAGVGRYAEFAYDIGRAVDGTATRSPPAHGMR